MNKYSNLTEEERKEYHRKRALLRYYEDPSRSAEASKKWRESNKEYIASKQKEKKRENKQKAIEYLGNKCNRCGQQFHPAVYEFHHTDPNTKDKDPSKMLLYSWDRVVKELDKCILLCANCHRLTHHEGNY